MLSVNEKSTFFFLPSTQDEREARETVKREQDEAYRVSLEADRKKVQRSWVCRGAQAGVAVCEYELACGECAVVVGPGNNTCCFNSSQRGNNNE